MPRNSSGTCSKAEPSFVPSTPISSTAVNSDIDDIIEMMTDSLSRTGDGGMQATLPLSGSGFNYQGDADTGISRSAANTQVITCGGTDVIEVTTTGANITGTVDADAFTAGGISIVLPAGVMFPYGGASAPTGYLLCDGTSYLRATYPALFTAIGTAYGSADGTHFNVPDLRGRIPAGKDGSTGRLTSATMTPDGNTLGAAGGLETETLSQANLPVATLSTTITTGQPHTHNLTGLGLVSVTNGGGASQGNLLTTSGGTPTTLTTGNNSATIAASTALGGSGTGHVNVQPTLIVNYIICVGA